MDLEALIRAQVAACTTYTEVFVDEVLGDASRRAPVDEGTLRASHGRDTDRRPDGATVTGYFATPYAAAQHEHVEWHHPKGGGPKYLEGALKDRVNDYPRGLARAVAAINRRFGE